jgi:glycogenin glucosyltransferase
MSGEAFVTLATNDRYSYGAAVLGQSIRNTNTSRKIVVIITPAVSQPARRILSDVFDRVIQVDPLDSSDPTHLALMSRPELGVTFTKLHCWNLSDYSKVVFLDADTLVLSNVDELFERAELSAAADIGWPDCFNSGVMVLEPNPTTFTSLLKFASDKGSFDGADQGLLNQFFPNWSTGDSRNRLPFIYNMAATTTYSYLPAFLHYGQNVKIVHFLGSNIKPWDHRFNADSDELILHPASPTYADFTRPYLKVWWQIFSGFIRPIVNEATGQDSMSGTGEVIAPWINAGHTVDWAAHGSRTEPASQQSWESGSVDYTGADRFENIASHLESVIKAPAAKPASAPVAKAAAPAIAPAKPTEPKK